MTAEFRRHIFIGAAVHQDLCCPLDRQLHGIGLAIMVGNFGRLAAQELRHRIVAEVQIEAAL